jgi:class 3 adenylate cyclase
MAPELARLALDAYTSPGDLVVDPMCGVLTSLVEAIHAGRDGFNAMVTGLRERRRLQDIFGRHVGEQVALRALEGGVQLGGELRRASILFVDLVGSTALAETLPPKEVVNRLNRFFAIVVDRVEAEGGWVDKFEGDGALAVFGVPLQQDDHPGRALATAQAIMAAVASAGTDVGIGVASGVVVAGNIGTERYATSSPSLAVRSTKPPDWRIRPSRLPRESS